MIIAIHPDKIASGSYSEKWAEFLKKCNINVKWVDLTATDWIEQVKGCDGVMWRMAHTPNDKNSAYRILYAIEYYLKIPVFPSYDTCWHFDEKLSQYYLMKAADIPMPAVWIFWNRQEALNWASKTTYPKVFKLSAGASSSNVRLVNSAKEAYRLINLMFSYGIYPSIKLIKASDIPFITRGKQSLLDLLRRCRNGFRWVFLKRNPVPQDGWWRLEKDYVYFQEFVPGNEYDTRITVIGDRAFGFRRWNRPNDFRASGSGNFDVDPAKIDRRCVKLAFDVSGKLNSQSMAYDIIFKDNELFIVEISYTYADWAVQKCPGHWKPDLTWVEGNMWPEEAHVEDFIKYIERFKTTLE